ncbi:MAG: GSCFA domain-containing protein, partial [Cyanobacteria bacterium J06635_13]
DIIVANTMSKSTLRSAIGELVEETENVDYFPSYESAMLSDPNIVWMGDRRNVTDFIVTKIVLEFINRYGLRG